MLGCALALGAQQPRSRPGTFTPPTQFAAFEQAATPAELAALEPEIEADHQLQLPGRARSMADGANESLAELVGESRVTVVTLGPVGKVYWVQLKGCEDFEDCPAVLLQPHAGGFEPLLRTERGRLAVLAGASGVPDLVVGGYPGLPGPAPHRFRYQNGRYVAAGQAVSDETWLATNGFTASDYAAASKKLGTAVIRGWNRAQGIWVEGGSRYSFGVIKTAPCDALGNCRLHLLAGSTRYHGSFLFAGHSVDGWGAARGQVVQQFEYPLIIATHIAVGRDEYRQYREIVSWPQVVGLRAEACEAGTPAATAAVYCSDGQPVPETNPPYDALPILTAVQAGDGAVYAMSPQTGQPLQRWQDRHWMPLPAPAPLVALATSRGYYHLQPVRLWATPGGEVAVLWDVAWSKNPAVLGNHLSAMTLRRGATVTLESRVSSLDLDLPWLRIIAGHGAPLVVGTDVEHGGGSPHKLPELARLLPDGTLDISYRFQPSQFFPGADSYASLNDIRDSEGRLWFWSTYPGSPAPRRLRGVVIGKGSSFRQLATIPGMPDAPIDSLWPWDLDHLAAIVSGAGIFLIDIHTLAARPLDPPRPGAFLSATRVYTGGLRHFIAGTGGLWEEDAGAWRQVNGRLPCNCWEPNYAMLAMPLGFWSGTFTQGLYFQSLGVGNLQHLDWRQRLPLQGAFDLFPLANGHLLAVGMTGSAELPTAPPAAASAPLAPQILAIENFRLPLRTDATHHFWGRRQGQWKEWTGTRWLTHAGSGPPALLPLARRPAFPPLGGNPLAPPEQCETLWPSSIVQDARGNLWWTADGNVYESTGSQCRIVLPASEAQPYVDHHHLSDVQLDGNGHALLHSLVGDLQQYVLVSARPKGIQRLK